MKYLPILLFLIAIPTLAYDYQDENIQLTILANGNWELWLEGVLYKFEWFLTELGRIMKVSGGDVCYWLFEVGGKLATNNCI